VPPHLRKPSEDFSILDRAETTQRMAHFLSSYAKAPGLDAGSAN